MSQVVGGLFGGFSPSAGSPSMAAVLLPLRLWSRGSLATAAAVEAVEEEEEDVNM